MDPFVYGRVLVALALVAVAIDGLFRFTKPRELFAGDSADYPVCPLCEHCGPVSEFAPNADGDMVCKDGCQ